MLLEHDRISGFLEMVTNLAQGLQRKVRRDGFYLEYEPWPIFGCLYAVKITVSYVSISSQPP